MLSLVYAKRKQNSCPEVRFARKRKSRCGNGTPHLRKQPTSPNDGMVPQRTSLSYGKAVRCVFRSRISLALETSGLSRARESLARSACFCSKARRRSESPAVVTRYCKLLKKSIRQNTNFNRHSCCGTIDQPFPIIYSTHCLLGRPSPAEMNSLATNASRIGREERLRLLALSTAILGLVLAPLGLSG